MSYRILVTSTRYATTDARFRIADELRAALKDQTGQRRTGATLVVGEQRGVDSIDLCLSFPAQGLPNRGTMNCTELALAENILTRIIYLPRSEYLVPG